MPNVSNAAILKEEKKKIPFQPSVLSHTSFHYRLEPQPPQEMGKLGHEAPLNAVSFSDMLNISKSFPLSFTCSEGQRT